MSWVGPCVTCGEKFSGGDHHCKPATLAKIESEQQKEAEQVEEFAYPREQTEYGDRLRDGFAFFGLGVGV